MKKVGQYVKLLGFLLSGSFFAASSLASDNEGANEETIILIEPSSAPIPLTQEQQLLTPGQQAPVLQPAPKAPETPEIQQTPHLQQAPEMQDTPQINSTSVIQQ